MRGREASAVKAILRRLAKEGLVGVRVSPYRESVLLSGSVKSREEKVRAGYAAAGRGFAGVVNDIEVRGEAEEREPRITSRHDNLLEGRSFDVLIIGGGVIGTALARELSRLDISIAILEKESDLAMHQSGRNDGMIHPGFAASPGTLKAHYNVRGNRMYDKLCRELDIPFGRPGSMILFPSPWYLLLLPLLKRRARKNGVDAYRRLSRGEVARLEPHITDKQHGAFYFPSAGHLSPYNLVNALAESSVENGAELFLECAVTGFEMEEGRITKVLTNRGSLGAGVVVNAAGIWSDWVAALADDRFFSLHGRKGVDAILDLKSGAYQTRIAAMPDLIGQRDSRTKGGGIVPTIEGNILVGPTAREVPDREHYETDPEDLKDLFTRLQVNPALSPSQVITYFAGIRACTWEEDFIVGPSRRVANLVHLAGIQSPGLASAPAIAEDAALMCRRILERDAPETPVREKKNFISRRHAPPDPKKMKESERHALILKDPAYGRIVCRCEGVSEGEVRDALRRPVPVTSLDGVKRRTRIATGRCQGGFCTPRVLEIMARELGCPMESLTKKGGASYLLVKETKCPEEVLPDGTSEGERDGN